MAKRIIRRPEVERRTGLKRAAIYDQMARGQFPRQVPLGDKAVGWVEEEIDAWLATKIAQRDSGNKPRRAA